ncbi:MAG TPA: ATP-binding protein [bacterium]|nr:ATP-binding protein [bacterium]
MSSPADILWWTFLATILAVAVLVAALGAAMVIAQRRLVALHRGYAQRLLAAQENERARVAREVHDDAVQRLAMVSHELNELRKEPPFAGGERRLAGIQGDVEDLTISLRNLAHQLHPSVIEQLGLAAALEQLADEMAPAGLMITLALPDRPPSLRPDRALVLYRVAQEALRNTAQHAGVSAAAVRLASTPHGVELVVSDGGRGFDPAFHRRNRGIGLLGISERAELVGGRATIESRPGYGTTVTLRVPEGVDR